ncbi:MAG: glycosyltransferase family 4 protein, partial [Promethearchaeota archaeon]
TNRFIGKKLLSKEAIKKKLKGIKRESQLKFATMKIFNKYLDFPYPWEVLKLSRRIKNQDVVYSSIGNVKIDLMLIFFYLLNRNTRFIIGYRKPLYSEKLFSIYNIKYRIAILLFSLFKKRFYHHALSKHAKNFLDKFYPPRKVIHIVHGIELNDYLKESNLERRKDILKFCYIGFLDDIHKGIGILLEAINLVLEGNENLKVSFEFCGTGPLAPQVRELEEKYPRYVKYYGYISNELISDYYMNNDVYLFSSRREPFPRAIMEALGAKLIIICSKTIGSIELLKGKEFGFFISSLEPISIKEKILEVYNLWKSDPVKFRELQDSAKKFVFQNYSTSREIEMFRDLIAKITKVKR